MKSEMWNVAVLFDNGIVAERQTVFSGVQTTLNHICQESDLGDEHISSVFVDRLPL